MSENIKNVEETEALEEANTTEVEETVEQDTSMDLQSLMTKVEEKEEEVPTVTEQEETEETVEEELSPLDQAMKNKKSGIEMNTDEITMENEPKVFKNIMESEEREEDFNEKMDELSELAKKAQLVVCIRKPMNQGEDALMMDEIDEVYVDEFGKTIVPENAQFIRAKETEEEKKAREIKEEENKDTDGDEPTEHVEGEEISLEDVKHHEERRKVINIIMDKTGLGREVLFTQEEQKVIDEANEIHITEVENLELESLDVEYDDSGDDFDAGFMSDVENYQLSISKVSMVFPCSGFKADMLGMSWGELADITLDFSDESEDMLNFDKVYKKCTVIYNKMKNISCGKFVDFKDFLKKFAYVDLPLATYGLLIATQPETDTIGLRCQKDDCGTRFNQKYDTRSLIDLDTAGDKYLEMIKRIANAVTAQDFVNVANISDVRNVKRLKLPASGFVVEVGPISMYDYLYKALKVLKVFQTRRQEAEERGEEYNEEESTISFLLQVLRAINIPMKNGKYKRVTNGLKMLQLLTKYCAASDMEILSAIYTSCQSQYNIEFSVKKAICPKCGTVTEKVEVTPDELVFYARQRLVTTNITVDNFPSR